MQWIGRDCKLSDYKPVNGVAELAIPNGTFRCYHCNAIKRSNEVRPTKVSGPYLTDRDLVIRKAIALQVAVIEYESSDISDEQAMIAIDLCVKEIIKAVKLLKKNAA